MSEKKPRRPGRQLERVYFPADAALEADRESGTFELTPAEDTLIQTLADQAVAKVLARHAKAKRRKQP